LPGSHSQRSRHRRMAARPRWRAEAVPQGEAISNLRNAREEAGGGSLELDNVRPRIWIHEDRIRLTYQNVVKLRIEMTQPRRGRSISTEEIELYERSCCSYIADGNMKVCRKSALPDGVEVVGTRCLWNRNGGRDKRVRQTGRPRVEHAENVSYSAVALPTAMRCCSGGSCIAGGNGGMVLSIAPVCSGAGTGFRSVTALARLFTPCMASSSAWIWVICDRSSSILACSLCMASSCVSCAIIGVVPESSTKSSGSIVRIFFMLYPPIFRS
jgi:hypothetical protein